MAIARYLTAGEIELARQVYGNSIAYEAVKIHDGPRVWFQAKNSGMTPRGEIYMRDCYSADYSKGDVNQRGFFIHEMAHVWQFQNKIVHPVAAAAGLQLKHKFKYGSAYAFELEKDKDLTSYGMEQQAAIIQEYFVRKHEKLDTKLHEDVLKNFLEDPAYARQKRFSHPFRGRQF
jgi:hypothetical protein